MKLKVGVYVAVLVALLVIAGVVPSAAEELPWIAVSKMDIQGVRVEPLPHIAKTEVWIKDEFGNPVEGATVPVQVISPLVVQFREKMTSFRGFDNFRMHSMYEGVWQTCVLFVEADGFWYNPAQNAHTCVTMWYP